MVTKAAKRTTQDDVDDFVRSCSHLEIRDFMGDLDMGNLREATAMVRKHRPKWTVARAEAVVASVVAAETADREKLPHFVSTVWISKHARRLGVKWPEIMELLYDDEGSPTTEKFVAAGGPAPVGRVPDYGMIWSRDAVEAWAKKLPKRPEPA